MRMNSISLRVKKAALLIAVLLPVMVRAQVPGYAGKKLAVMYNNNFSPVLGSSGLNYKGNRGILALNCRHLVGLEYVQARRRVIGFGAGYMRTALFPGGYGFQYEKGKNYEVSGGDTTYKSTYYQYAPYGIERIPVHSASLHLYWKFFKKQFIAPCGNYQYLDFGAIRYWQEKLVLDPFTYTMEEAYLNTMNYTTSVVRHPATVTPQLDDTKSTSFIFGYGFGRQRIVNDKIMLDYGLRFRMLFGPSDLSDMATEVRTRLRNASWLGFNIGIGYLAGK